MAKARANGDKDRMGVKKWVQEIFLKSSTEEKNSISSHRPNIQRALPASEKILVIFLKASGKPLKDLRGVTVSLMIY